MKNDLKFEPGYIVNEKYEILDEIGSGYEGRVYLVREVNTDIERTIKFFYPLKNKGNKTIKAVAKKLHRLRSSNILIQYHTQDVLKMINGTEVSFLISEFVEGLMLSDFLKEQRGGRLQPFKAVHLLYELVRRVEEVHRLGEYHADIHTDNILVQQVGLKFELKLLDPFHWVGATKRDGQKDDIVNIVEVFYESIGASKYYQKQPQVIKDICLGMKKPFILRRFKTLTKLREHLETFEW